MPRRTNSLQRLVTRIFQHMAGPAWSVQESVLLREPGIAAEREVDLYLEQPTLGTVIKGAVECRARKRRDDIEWIDGLLGKYRDLGIDKIFAVSKSGFTKAAEAKARANRVVPLHFRRAVESDWTAEFICPRMGSFSRTDTLQTVGVVTEPRYPPPLDIYAALFDENGQQIGALGDIGMAFYATGQRMISAKMESYFRGQRLDEVRSTGLTAILQIPVPSVVVYLNDSAGSRCRVSSFILRFKCTFTFTSVPVEHFTLGDARASLATIACAGQGTYSVAALQASNKPKQLGVYSERASPRRGD